MYATLKLLHLLAVVLFLGNIITGLFWHAHAARTRDPKLLAFTMDGIIRSDRWFTLPGVTAVVVLGVALAILAKLPLLRTPWILGSIVAISLSGFVYAWRVAPLQRRMFALAHASSAQDFNYPQYRALAVAWELWGALALATPLAALALMTFKPTFA